MQQSRASGAPYLILIIGGVIFGVMGRDSFAPLIGALVGYLLADNMNLKGQLAQLRRAGTGQPSAADSEAGVDEGPAHPDDDRQAATAAAPPQVAPLAAAESSGPEAVTRPAREQDAPAEEPLHPAAQHPPPAAPDHRADLFRRGLAGVKNFFTSGNIILKIGLIVLFFGVSFLLKYAAQRNLVPVELRLTGVCLGGLALLAFGWRLRLQRPAYGRLLQGGGIGILYLTIFAAAKLYHLLPFGLAFPIMLAIVLLAGALAVLQDEQWLALAGSTGGFLAPVLLSTGGGSHVALFSYYLLLNLGILGIAWFKTWRPLNLLGFVFTYAIGSLWGAGYYQPGYFATVEPFLLVSFLLYSGISVLFACKQPVDLKGYIDPPLVFGLPIITFALQYGLVREMEYGLALSAVGFGLYYLCCALLLWRRRQEELRMLVEIYLSFGVVFGSLAIPLALDGHWITAAWALEGAALIWVGARQNRLKARLFGILLQVGAGVAFLDTLGRTAANLPLLNGIFLSCLLLALAGLFSAYYLAVRANNLRSWEAHAVIPLLIWGLCWWFGGGTREIGHFAPVVHQPHLFLLFVAASFLLTAVAADRLSWRHLEFPSLALLPVLGLLSLNPPLFTSLPHLFAGWGAPAWTLALAFQYTLLRISENKWPPLLTSLSHPLSLWLLLFILSRESAWIVAREVDGPVWTFLCWGLVPAAGIILLRRSELWLAWPLQRFRREYQILGPAGITVYLFGWGLAALRQAGDPAPLPYLPLLNPLEVFQGVVLLVCLRWALANRPWIEERLRGLLPQPILFLAGTVLFLWLNAAVARGVHSFARVPYDALPLFHSPVFQASVAILWSLTALTVMIYSARRLHRPLWMAGGGLLGLVVLKLFLIDLSGTGTIGRIVSFLAVGLLMLLIGYFSPLPPRPEAKP